MKPIASGQELAARIRRRQFDDPAQSALQERLIGAVASDPEPFLARYIDLPNSFQGRFVNSDMLKLTVPEYAESRAARERCNLVVHNACAVLTAEHFRRVLAEPVSDGARRVYMLTGAPGAGKTASSIRRAWPEGVHAIYEGQLANPEVALEKVGQVLDAGLHPVIQVVHVRPERAMANALTRFERFGRPTSPELLAGIQGNLRDSLAVVKEQFGERANIIIFDKRDFAHGRILYGWEHLGLLASEGNAARIRERLEKYLELRNAGAVAAAVEQTGTAAPPDASGEERMEAIDARNAEATLEHMNRITNDPAFREEILQNIC